MSLGSWRQHRHQPQLDDDLLARLDRRDVQLHQVFALGLRQRCRLSGLDGAAILGLRAASRSNLPLQRARAAQHRKLGQGRRRRQRKHQIALDVLAGVVDKAQVQLAFHQRSIDLDLG